MLVCLNGHWKLPIAYFLIDSISGNELSELVKKALILIDNCGIVCRSITFDGARTNLTCCKILGANLVPGLNFQPWFLHPCKTNEKVFLIFDTPHAIKLIRNTVGDFTLVDEKGGLIAFSDFINLYNYQEEKGPTALASAPKLTKRHIMWRENKMRVRLAAQLFSTSVYAALTLLQQHIPKFESCDGTATFCK